jgi:hypothetical protein
MPSWRRSKLVQFFIADVTPVGASQGRKPLTNPNVAIELGYALSSVGLSACMVLNLAHGYRETLPFDLRHKRGPITYTLTDEALSSEIAVVRKKLIANLKRAVGPFSTLVAVSERFEEVTATTAPSRYFAAGEVLATGTDYRSDGRLGLIYPDEPLLYLRLIPSRPTALLSGSQVSELVRDAMLSPLRTGLGGWSTHRNLHGGIVYSNDNTGTSLLSSTQLFRKENYGVSI